MLDKHRKPENGGVPQIADPPYPNTHSGPVLVCGSATGLLENVAAARSIYPDAPIIAVNGAARHVEAAFLFSQHPLDLQRWAHQQRRFHDNFEVHTAGIRHRKTKLGVEPPMPWIDYRWQGVSTNASSGWGARRLAHALGFDLVILCGVPLVKLPYVDGWGGKSMWRDQRVVDHYRREMEADADWHAGAFSMSGWTQDLLGAPA